MKYKYITKTYTQRTLHPNTVRAILVKSGYDVGTWHSSGMVRGYRTFDGTVEVSEYEISSTYDRESLGNNLTRITTHKNVCVLVGIHGKGVKIDEVVSILKDSGLEVKNGGFGDLIVDNKELTSAAV